MQDPMTSSRHPAGQSTPKDRTWMAILALVLGLIGILAWLLPICGIPLGLAGTVLGFMGRESPRKGLATVGFVLCFLSLIFAFGNAAYGAYLGVTGQLFP